jgi:hypothetical protein
MASRRYGWDEINQELVDGYLRIVQKHREGRLPAKRRAAR